MYDTVKKLNSEIYHGECGTILTSDIRTRKLQIWAISYYLILQRYPLPLHSEANHDKSKQFSYSHVRLVL